MVSSLVSHNEIENSNIPVPLEIPMPKKIININSGISDCFE